MKEKDKKVKISDLIPDNHNYNKGNEFGNSLIEKSLRSLGAGRSILLDKNNRIIAGNKTIENAGSIGLEDVIIVETTGNQIVAVKRTDIDLDSKKGREMALADNATAKSNIEWDLPVINEDWNKDEQKEWGLNFDFDTTDYSDKNREINIDAMDDEMIIKLKFTESEYHLVKGQLSKISETPEQAVWKLLGNE